MMETTTTTPEKNGAVTGASAPPRRRAVSPLNGVPTPAGRPKGIPNKTTRTIREAVEMAARDCHPRGLAGWLIERAQGGIQDRQIFAAMVAKALPLQVHASGSAGVTINLAWLAGRAVAGGTVTTQSDRNTLIIDADTRSNDPGSDAQPANQSASEAENPRADDPHPPVEPAHPPG